ncbi:MAG: hypothetical protein HPY59_04965 [Anaerolineae bacterium]|nr:hypothetical protein [Anaerolineae bacterium]
MARRIILTLFTLILAICIGLSLLAIFVAIVLLATPGINRIFAPITLFM